MAHEDLGVPHFPKRPKLFRDLVDRTSDQGFCRHAAVALGEGALQYGLCLGERLPDVNVAPQDDRARLPAVSRAALLIEIGLGTRLASVLLIVTLWAVLRRKHETPITPRRVMAAIKTARDAATSS